MGNCVGAEQFVKGTESGFTWTKGNATVCFLVSKKTGADTTKSRSATTTATREPDLRTPRVAFGILYPICILTSTFIGPSFAIDSANGLAPAEDESPSSCIVIPRYDSTDASGFGARATPQAVRSSEVLGAGGPGYRPVGTIDKRT